MTNYSGDVLFSCLMVHDMFLVFLPPLASFSVFFIGLSSCTCPLNVAIPGISSTPSCQSSVPNQSHPCPWLHLRMNPKFLSLAWTSPSSSRCANLLAGWPSLLGCLKGTVNSPCPRLKSQSSENAASCLSERHLHSDSCGSQNPGSFPRLFLYPPLPHQTQSVTRSDWFFLKPFFGSYL